MLLMTDRLGPTIASTVVSEEASTTPSWETDAVLVIPVEDSLGA